MQKSAAQPPTIPCSLLPETKERIERFADELRLAAPKIGSHGLEEDAFWASGLFKSAIERLRGRQAATTNFKRAFLDEVLTHLKDTGKIKGFAFTGAGDRHDYQVRLAGDRLAVFEAKGCLDGNNTTIFQRPPNADEFFIWSLCQNAGADPRKNVWSGIHTRLGAAIVAERRRVDALIVWDMLCGTAARPCPKIADGGCSTLLHGGRSVPPPCIYLFPRTVPDPRNNPAPPVWKLHELPFVHALAQSFGCPAEQVVEVHIHTRMKGNSVQRQTSLFEAGRCLHESRWTNLKRGLAQA